MADLGIVTDNGQLNLFNSLAVADLENSKGEMQRKMKSIKRSLVIIFFLTYACKAIGSGGGGGRVRCGFCQEGPVSDTKSCISEAIYGQGPWPA